MTSVPDKNAGRAAAATAWKKRRRNALLPEMSTVPQEGGLGGVFEPPCCAGTTSQMLWPHQMATKLGQELMP